MNNPPKYIQTVTRVGKIALAASMDGTNAATAYARIMPESRKKNAGDEIHVR